ncbi:hypothetical protein F4823DRAFT_569083 [Ustulina deusta]|nr:hypothetical protein F4823DRAFT_569083 [Ustulina deusta]
MYSKTETLIFLGIASISGLANAIQVGYGQQIQNSDQTNHWVIWVEGDHACPGMSVIGSLAGSSCGQGFVVDGSYYQFGGCGGGNEPGQLLDSSGSSIGGCSRKDNGYKISCHDGLHDIVKHGVCG